jgi:hypothetical protein
VGGITELRFSEVAANTGNSVTEHKNVSTLVDQQVKETCSDSCPTMITNDITAKN